VFLDVEVRRVDCRACGRVRQERLDWLADHPFYTRRFAFFVGRRCRESTVQAVAKELRLDWESVKALDVQYMTEQLRRVGTPGPAVIGIDEVSVGRGHSYRIVVSDLLRRRAIWFGGTGRTEADLDLFFQWLGPRKCRGIRLAVMDMWPAFRASTLRPGNAPHARILYDKFHVLRHLGDAIDAVRKAEYKRVAGDDRRFIKGQKYTLLSHRQNLTSSGRASLALLLKANRRLNTAYVLKESFAQLWGYRTEAGARRFLDRWRDALKWQRLGPYEKFVAMIDKHWDGIAPFCDPANKGVPLGYVEGFNNKIRALQRRAYGFHDEEYLRLKILTSGLRQI
jgi:transposase